MNIVFAYESGLPARWMAGIQWFKRKLSSAGVGASVSVVPIEGLRGDVDVVLATRACADQAQLRAPGARLVVLDSFERQGLYEKLVEELRFTEKCRLGAGTSDQPIVMTYRGDERID